MPPASPTLAQAYQMLQEAHRAQIESSNLIAQELGRSSAINAACEKRLEEANKIIHRHNNLRQQELAIEQEKLEQVKSERQDKKDEIEIKKKFYERLSNVFEKPKDLIIFLSILIGNIMLLLGVGDKGLLRTLIDILSGYLKGGA